MKKVLSVVFAVFILIATVLPSASALSEPVNVPELNLELSAPDGWYVFTRNTDAEDPVFDAFEGIDKEYMDRFFEQGSIYYNAIERETAMTEIVVAMFPEEEIFDWSDFVEKAYDEFAKEFMTADTTSAADAEDVEYSDYEMVEHPQCTLMKLHGRILGDAEQTSLVHYITIVNGQYISIMFFSYNGTLSSADERMFDKILQSMRFTEVKDKPFSFPSLLLSENFRVISAVTSLAVLAVVIVVVILVITGSRRKKRRLMEKLQQEQHEREQQAEQFAITQAPPFTPEQPIDIDFKAPENDSHPSDKTPGGEE